MALERTRLCKEALADVLMASFRIRRPVLNSEKDVSCRNASTLPVHLPPLLLLLLMPLVAGGLGSALRSSRRIGGERDSQ